MSIVLSSGVSVEVGTAHVGTHADLQLGVWYRWHGRASAVPLAPVNPLVAALAWGAAASTAVAGATAAPSRPSASILLDVFLLSLNLIAASATEGQGTDQ